MTKYEYINQNSGKEDWATPQSFFDMIDKEYHFTLDPCCYPETAKCPKYFTEEDDGLKQDWGGERVFMNPPYCGKTEEWIAKAYNESLKPNTLVACLIVARTDTGYWHKYIFPYASEIKFVHGRLKFGGCDKSAPFSSALVVFKYGDTGKYKDLVIERM